ncbi:AraC family transcriptional regulator [Ascidiimonas aurantiaca]|uniref:helix-turn-helix domain-containing protein n=1 Tax=Ascidiimonas aurantiaca TaxID=1685432 RepID=UPI0030EC1308
MEGKVVVNTIDVHEAIKSLSQVFSTDYEQENNEMCFQIPEKWGKGYVNAVSFSHGVGILDIDIRLNEPLVLEFNNSNIQPLKFLYNREEIIKHTFSDSDDETDINRLESIMVAADIHAEHVLVFRPDKSICVFIISVNRKEFEKKVEDFLPGMNKELEALFRDVNGINRFLYQGYYSLDIAENIEACIECELTDFPRSVFLEGKVYEILGHQLRQYLDDLNTPEKRKILRKSTLNAIEQAAEIITQELDRVDNVLRLAKRVGLNQNTLQQGFKQVYGKSINAYMKDLRLKQAKELLESSDMNITEISYAIGINSRSYFSKIFREKFGMTPKEYRFNSQGKVS